MPKCSYSRSSAISFFFFPPLINLGFSLKTPKPPRKKKSCQQIPKQQCQTNVKHVAKEECRNVPKKQCRTVPKKQCKDVSRQVAKQVPEQRCEQVPKEKCRKTTKSVPKTECKQVKGGSSLLTSRARKCLKSQDIPSRSVNYKIRQQNF